MKGKVLWFDVKKGYGFIKSIAGDDVFVHYSKIKEDEPGEFRVLYQGDEVEFETFFSDRGDGSKKLQAKDVKIVKRADRE
jgi:CspA family cold shock protein